MRLVSWNIAVRTDCTRHVNAIHERNPDIVALQEVNHNSLSQLGVGLHRIGLNNVIDNAALAARFGRKHYYSVIASRWPLRVLPFSDFNVPFQESVFSVIISSPTYDFELHTTHIPPGSGHGWIKIETFEGIYTRLARNADAPRILCGDFNSPRLEKPNGQIVTWGQTEKSNVVRKGMERWDAGERCVIAGLKNYDLTDVFRLLHGYEVQEFSLVMRRNNKITRRRFDHVFASSVLNPVACHYLHQLREQGMSNHSPVEVDFAPKTKCKE